MTLNSDNVL